MPASPDQWASRRKETCDHVRDKIAWSGLGVVCIIVFALARSLIHELDGTDPAT